ncbi:uncharacterized protein EURHEDRAFT_417877, partial [Aspergillus ruber CBS 135680]
HGIHEDDIWNFDETGFAMGLCTTSRPGFGPGLGRVSGPWPGPQGPWTGRGSGQPTHGPMGRPMGGPRNAHLAPKLHKTNA